MAVTAASFKARFPEFAPVSDQLITLMIGEAEQRVGETWAEHTRDRATMYLVAHMLVMEGEPGRSTAITGSKPIPSGPVKRRKVGDVETEYATGPNSGASSSGSAVDGYRSTVYGAEFYRLLRGNFPAIRTV